MQHIEGLMTDFKNILDEIQTRVQKWLDKNFIKKMWSSRKYAREFQITRCIDCKLEGPVAYVIYTSFAARTSKAASSSDFVFVGCLCVIGIESDGSSTWMALHLDPMLLGNFSSTTKSVQISQPCLSKKFVGDPVPE
jgi:hypothetical protein